MTEMDDAAKIEEARWVLLQFTFTSPEQFEKRRNEPWIRPGTRNHGRWAGGIQREEYQDEKAIEVTDANVGLFQGLVVGRTITAFEREQDSGVVWSHGENSVTITLDDGSVLSFVGVGHDASGLITSYSPRPDDRAGEGAI